MVEINTWDKYPDLYKPKRMMRYVLLWCTAGEAKVVVDEKTLTLPPHHVLTITSGQVHYFKQGTPAKGVALEFTLDFFCKDDKDIELVFHNGLFCHFDLNEVIHIPNQELISTHLEHIRDELMAQPYQYLTSVHAHIELILVEINRSKVKRGDEIWKPDALFLKFLELVRANFAHNYPVSEHAQLLSTTESKLNEQAKLHAGKTAQNVIYGLIASEAKRLLIYDNLSIKEVAYQLGFNDPFYFSNFFKKHTGQSPKAFQSTHTL